MAEAKYIPVYIYAKENGISEQNVYRWIREKKIKEKDLKIEERVVKRILINEDGEIPEVRKKD